MDNVCSVESDKASVLASTDRSPSFDQRFQDSQSPCILCSSTWSQASVELTSPYTGKVTKIHHKVRRLRN